MANVKIVEIKSYYSLMQVDGRISCSFVAVATNNSDVQLSKISSLKGKSSSSVQNWGRIL